jgi:hypothetical protein
MSPLQPVTPSHSASQQPRAATTKNSRFAMIAAVFFSSFHVKIGCSNPRPIHNIDTQK